VIFIYRELITQEARGAFNAEKNPSNLSPDNTGVGKPEIPALVMK
jgi:hypothetical protein